MLDPEAAELRTGATFLEEHTPSHGTQAPYALLIQLWGPLRRKDRSPQGDLASSRQGGHDRAQLREG